MIDIVFDWINLGISVLPTYPGTKYLFRGTRIKDYVENTPSPVDVIKWFAATRNNLAIVPKQANDEKYLVVLDFDSIVDYLRWQSETEIETRTVTTRRGKHVYLWCRQSPEGYYSKVCEIKYHAPVIAVPSVVKGHRYTSDGKEIVEVEEVSKAGLRPDPPSKKENCTDSCRVASFFTRRIPPKAGIVSFIKLNFPISILFPHHRETGNGMAIAHCPGKAHKNEDKHPSLSLDLKTNRANCFKSGCEFSSKHGNSNIDAWMILNNVNFKMAIKQMAEQLGI